MGSVHNGLRQGIPLDGWPVHLGALFERLWVQYLAQVYPTNALKVFLVPPLLPEHLPFFVYPGARTSTFQPSSQLTELSPTPG